MKKLFGVLVVMVLFSGCAFVRYETPLNYSYKAAINGEKSLEDVLISVGNFTDERSISEPNMIVNIINANGQKTKGGYLAEKPIAEIVSDGLQQGLISRGAVVGMDPDKTIEGIILDYDLDSIMHAFSASLTGKLTVKILIKDNLNKIIWRDTFVGKGDTKSVWGTRKEIRDNFNASLDDLISKVISDGYFIDNVKS